MIQSTPPDRSALRSISTGWLNIIHLLRRCLIPLLISINLIFNRSNNICTLLSSAIHIIGWIICFTVVACYIIIVVVIYIRCSIVNVIVSITILRWLISRLDIILLIDIIIVVIVVTYVWLWWLDSSRFTIVHDILFRVYSLNIVLIVVIIICHIAVLICYHIYIMTLANTSTT